MKNYILPEDLREALMGYLRTRPYGEVVDGMKALESLEEAPESAPELKVVEEG